MKSGIFTQKISAPRAAIIKRVGTTHAPAEPIAAVRGIVRRNNVVAVADRVKHVPHVKVVLKPAGYDAEHFPDVVENVGATASAGTMPDSFVGTQRFD